MASGAREALYVCTFIAVSSVEVAQEVVHLWGGSLLGWFRYTYLIDATSSSPDVEDDVMWLP